MSRTTLVVLALSLVTACGGCDGPEQTLPKIDAGDAGVADGDAGTNVDERELILNIDQTDSVTIGALNAPVHVVRTAGDVPHIYAENEHDLYVASGWVLARDRYFEYEMASRLALGELGDMLGRFGIAADVDARGRGMAIVAQRVLEYMDEDTGARFDAFAQGINAYVDAVKAGEAPAPSELDLAAPLLGAATPGDVMRPADRRTLAGFAAFVVFQSSYVDHDVQRQITLDGLADRFPDDPLRRGGIDELFDDTTPRHAISVTPGFGLNGELPQGLSAFLGRPRVDGVARQVSLPFAMRERIRQKEDRLALWFGPREESDKGSDAWAVSSDQTADGGVLLAGDGHLPLGVPTLFFQMGYDLRTFGDDPLRVIGLFLPGFPFLAVGTNGDLAWSQTYPRADTIDWYREELQLDADGLPQASFFDGEWRDLVQVDEEYHDAGVLGDDPQDLVIPRWTTFDGRLITEIEGRTVTDPDTEMLAPGESLVNVTGTWVVPADEDGDGVVTGVSLDFTAFDVGNLAGSIEALQRSENVESFQQEMKNFVGYAQNLVAADRDGNVGYAMNTAIPCREYLPRDPDGNWLDGANPQLLLDGTQYGGFEVPVNEAGNVDLSLAGDDPQKCILPFDVFPRVVKDNGWVANANNDPHGGSFDGTLQDEPFHLGGPWVPGYRANAIVSRLEAKAGEHDIESMAAIQAHHGSQLGVDFGPELVQAVDDASALSGRPDGELSPGEIRARDMFDADSERLQEAAGRVQAWLDRGANAASGVETFYNSPSEDDRKDAVATMIFNAWLRQWILAVFEDEDIQPLLLEPGRARGSMIRALRNATEGRGPDNPLDLASWNPETEESIFFDDLTTPDATETSTEASLSALTAALDFLESESFGRGNGGFGTADMDQWLWGLRHRVVLDSILASFAGGNPAVGVVAKEFAIDTTVLPLAEDLDSSSPRGEVRWFPRPGDYFGVDASNPAFYGDDNFDYADGPVMRMVIHIAPDGSVKGQNVIPGGQSGLTDSPHFADQAALWLGNETLPLHYSPAQVAEGATGREVLTP
jgi:penicillin amidase